MAGLDRLEIFTRHAPGMGKPRWGFCCSCDEYVRAGLSTLTQEGDRITSRDLQGLFGDLDEAGGWGGGGVVEARVRENI